VQLLDTAPGSALSNRDGRRFMAVMSARQTEQVVKLVHQASKICAAQGMFPAVTRKRPGGYAGEVPAPAAQVRCSELDLGMLGLEPVQSRHRAGRARAAFDQPQHVPAEPMPGHRWPPVASMMLTPVVTLVFHSSSANSTERSTGA
jgi:hypothetical protein